MGSDQLARQWRVIMAIEASPNGLTVAESAKREKSWKRTVYRHLELLPAARVPLYTQGVDQANYWAFRNTCKFKTLPPFTFSSVIPQNETSKDPGTDAWITTT